MKDEIFHFARQRMDAYTAKFGDTMSQPQDVSWGCSAGCDGSCDFGCSGSCSLGCDGFCTTTCKGNCWGWCEGTCKGNCYAATTGLGL